MTMFCAKASNPRSPVPPFFAMVAICFRIDASQSAADCSAGLIARFRKP